MVTLKESSNFRCLDTSVRWHLAMEKVLVTVFWATCIKTLSFGIYWNGKRTCFDLKYKKALPSSQVSYRLLLLFFLTLFCKRLTWTEVLRVIRFGQCVVMGFCLGCWSCWALPEARLTTDFTWEDDLGAHVCCMASWITELPSVATGMFLLFCISPELSLRLHTREREF